MNTNKTYYDGLKAKVVVRPAGRATQNTAYLWELRDSGGELMAAGTEYQLKHAYTAAMEAVTGVRLWSVYARGALIPSDDGRRWFTFESTEYNQSFYHDLVLPTRKQLNELTKTKKKGKVKK